MTDATFDPSEYDEGDIVRFVYWASNPQSKEDRTVVGEIDDVVPMSVDGASITVGLESGKKYTAWTDGRVTAGSRNGPGNTVGYGPRVERVDNP